MKAEVEAALVAMCTAVGIAREDTISMSVDKAGVSFTIITRDENGNPQTIGDTDGTYLVKAYYAL